MVISYPVANQDLRQMMRVAGLPMWAVAMKLGISEVTLSRWLRCPVSSDKHRMIEDGIKRAAAERMVNVSADN